MTDRPNSNLYSDTEEKINVYSHALGIFLSIAALVFSLIKAVSHGDVWHIVSFTIYGISMITLYTASTLYHKTEDTVYRKRLKIFDHAAIYVFIAGSYTPYTLVTLKGTIGWVVFGISWGFAITGVILKLFFTGKYSRLSTAMYVLMGWIIVFAINPLIESIPSQGLQWLFAGGLSYTIGAILYSIKRIKFNHAVFHVLVLAGSIFHFVSLYFYVLPH
jgi:hemolysin III